jgi:chromosome segregation ATPase
LKHANDLEAKLKVAEKALEEANAKLTSKADEVVEIKSQVASHEAEICLRLDQLKSSFTSKF